MDGLKYIPLGLVILCSVFSGCHSFQASGKATVQDGKCVGDDGNLYAVGEKWYHDEHCVEIRCGTRNDELYEFITGCGAESYPDECVMEYPGGHFPDCCPEPVCDFSKKKSHRVRRNDFAFGGRKRRQLDPATLGAGAFGKRMKTRRERAPPIY